jgi:DNA-binding MarR family transcriptional regulator
MAINDEKLAAKVAVIRRDQSLRMQRRAGASVPAHVINDEVLDLVIGPLTEANLMRVWKEPGYRAAAIGLMEMGLPERADNALVIQALRDVTRFAAGVWALGLYAQPGGLTIARFNALAEAVGYGSRTWSHAAFAYLRFIGYIEPEASSDDRRERRFRPTARLRSGFRAHFVRQARIIAGVERHLEGYADQLAQDDATFDRFVIAASDAQLTAALIHRQNTDPTMDVFATRRNGMPMFWQLISAAPPGEKWPTAEWYPISISDLARRSGSSRAHFQRMLRDAEAAGMVQTDGQGNLRIRRRMRIEVNTFTGILMIGLETVLRIIDLQEAAANARAA